MYLDADTKKNVRGNMSVNIYTWKTQEKAKAMMVEAEMWRRKKKLITGLF